MGPFMSQKIVSITFFTTEPGTLFPGKSMCFHSMDCLFDSASQWKIHVLSICKHFLTKTFFSVHIPFSSVNFTWFALLNYQRFDD